MKKIAIIVLFSLAAIGPAMANMTQEPLHTGVRPWLVSGQAELAQEEVELVLGERVCQVKTALLLRNTSNMLQIITLGIPSNTPKDIMRLRVKLNSLFIPTQTKTEQSLEIMDMGGYEYSQTITTHWLLWDMKLKPGQNSSLEISYEVATLNAAVAQPTEYTLHRLEIMDEFAINEWDMTAEVKLVLDALHSRITGYELKGGNWQGETQVTINAFHPALGASVIRTASTTGSIDAMHRMQWKNADLSSSSTLRIEFNPENSRRQELKLVHSALARHPESHGLAGLVRFLEQSDKVQ